MNTQNEDKNILIRKDQQRQNPSCNVFEEGKMKKKDREFKLNTK